VSLSLGALLVVLNLLAWQLHAGSDPALGAGGAESQVAKKRVVVRRIIQRVVVTRVIPAVRSEPRAPTSTSPAPSAPTPSSAPAAAATAPAPAPAPAPPVVTRTS